MSEREILAELERLIADLAALKPEPANTERIRNLELSLDQLREGLAKSRARRAPITAFAVEEE